MDINRATELLLALADGIDPITGNRLPDESVYNNPEIIRAIHCLLRQLQARSDNAAAVNAGRSWHADEERQLLEEYDAGLSVDEIARRHGAAIRVRSVPGKGTAVFLHMPAQPLQSGKGGQSKGGTGE